jgi:hypothetical protein
VSSSIPSDSFLKVCSGSFDQLEIMRQFFDELELKISSSRKEIFFCT